MAINLNYLPKLVPILATFCLVSACSQSGAAPNAGGFAIPVKLAKVETGTIEDSSDYVATLQSRQSVRLQPQVTGQISQIFVKSGDPVEVGTPILQIDPSKQQASVSSSSAAVESAQADVDNAKANLIVLEAKRKSNLATLALNQQEYQRYSKLFTEGAATRQNLDQYTNNLRVAQADLDATTAQIQAQQALIARAERQVQQSQANVKEQQVQLQYYTITAPFTGTVGDIPIKVGDYVKDTTPLFSITQNQDLEVQISVPIEKAPQLRIGTLVKLLDQQDQPKGESRIFFISPSVNNQTQSVLVKALFKNTNNALRADQFVKARIVWNQKPGVLIPSTAISRLAGKEFVYVAQPKATEGDPKAAQAGSQLIAKLQSVKLGNLQGNKYQVIEGLQSGDRIVESVSPKLSNGVPIAPES